MLLWSEADGGRLMAEEMLVDLMPYLYWKVVEAEQLRW